MSSLNWVIHRDAVVIAQYLAEGRVSEFALERGRIRALEGEELE